MQQSIYKSLGSAATEWGWRLGGAVPPAEFLVREDGVAASRAARRTRVARIPGTRGLQEVQRPGGPVLVAMPDRILADAFADPLSAGGFRGLRVLLEAWLADEGASPAEVTDLLDLAPRRSPFHRLGYVLSLLQRETGRLPARGAVLLRACEERRGRGRVMLVPRGESPGGRFEQHWRLVLNDPAAPPLEPDPGEGEAGKPGGRPEVSAGSGCREDDPPAAVADSALRPTGGRETRSGRRGVALADPGPPSPGDIGALSPATLARWAARDRRAFDRLCADLLLLEARESGEVRRFTLPDDVDRADGGVDAFFELGSGAAHGPLLGPGRTVVQVKCRDPGRPPRTLFAELGRSARRSLRAALGSLGRFERFLLVTNLVLPPGRRRELEAGLREEAGTVVRDPGGRHAPPVIRVVGASEVASLVRARPHLLGHLGFEPDLCPLRAVREELAVEIHGRRFLPEFRGRAREVRRLRSLLGVGTGGGHPGPVVLLAPRDAGATRLVLEALGVEDVVPRAFWWKGERRPLEKILRATRPGNLWVVLDRLPRVAGDPGRWSELVRDHPGTHLLLVTDRPCSVPGAAVMELGELDHEAIDGLAGEMVRALECGRWGPGEGFRWWRALAQRSDGLPGKLVRIARRLASAGTLREREEALADIGVSRPSAGAHGPPSPAGVLPGLVALVGGVRTGSGLPSVPPPPELSALAGLAGLSVEETREVLLDLANRREGIRPVPGGVEPVAGRRDAMVLEMIERRPQLVHRALADPVLRARAAEGLGRLRGYREAVRFGENIVGEILRAVREGRPWTGTDLAVLSCLVFLVPREVVAVVRELAKRVAPADLAEDARRKVVEILGEALRRAESVLDALPLLEQLAVAENEPWANNATGLFRGVFDPNNFLVPLSFPERLRHLGRMKESADPRRLRLLLAVLPEAFRPPVRGRSLPPPEHWLPDLAPPATWAEVNRYRRAVLKTWERTIRDAAGIVGPGEAVATLRDGFLEILAGAIAGHSFPLARDACRLVSRLARAGIIPEEDLSWLAVFEEWRRWREARAGEEGDRRKVIDRIDREVGLLREELFPPGVSPFAEARRWLGPAVPWAAVGAGRDRRPERAARRLLRRYERDPSVLGEEEADWLVSGEAVHAELFWRMLGRHVGADPRVVDLLVARLGTERGPEALGAFLRGAARRDGRRVREVLGRVIDRCLADPSPVPSGDALLRLLRARGLAEVDPGDLARVFRAGRGISRVPRQVLLDPGFAGALASLSPAELEEIARLFGGGDGATVRLSCLEALVLAAERATDASGKRGWAKAAWRVAGNLPAGLERPDEWRWQRVFPRLVLLDPEPLGPWLRERLRAGRDGGQAPGVRDGLVLVREILQVRDGVPGRLLRTVLDAIHEAGFPDFGLFELPRWVDPLRHGEELLAWVRSRGDRRAWLLAARAVDLHREGGLELAVRLVERCDDDVRDAVEGKLCAVAVTSSWFVEETDRRLQALRERAAELAATGSTAAARSLGRRLEQAVTKELEETRAVYHDTWLDWDGTLGGLADEDFLRLPPEAPARRRWAGRVLESLRDRDVLALLTEQDIRQAIEAGEVREEVAERWRRWLERRRGRS